MRNVVRAAYSGRFSGASDSGASCNSDSGCSKWRLASATKTKIASVSRMASASQRVMPRAACSTEIGTVPRMVRPAGYLMLL